MARFRPFSVITVPFPYTDRPVRQRRPALVVSAEELETRHGLIWVAMITAAENRGWPEDVAIDDIEKAGLPIPSIIRPAKLATIEASEAEPRGAVSAAVRKAVAKALQRLLAG